MLQVSKRAASEADAKAILSASQQVQSPFGVPILLVDPDNYARKTFFGFPLPRLFLKKRIHEELLNTVAQCPPLLTPSATPIPGAVKVFEDRGYFNFSPPQLERRIIAAIHESGFDPTEAIAFAMPNQSPRISITLHRETPDLANQTVHRVLGANKGKSIDYPGFDAQYNFISLWHEHAHSVAGTNEAGAEKIAGLMSRYAFEDCTFLAVQADMRAVHSILHYNNEEILNNYGWPCVEVLDDAFALETPPTWDEIKALGETSYDTPHRARIDAIQNVGAVFNKKSALPFLFKDLKEMANTAEECLQQNALTTPEEIMIAERFALAARRLSIGRPAYQNAAFMPAPAPSS